MSEEDINQVPEKSKEPSIGQQVQDVTNIAAAIEEGGADPLKDLQALDAAAREIPVQGKKAVKGIGIACGVMVLLSVFAGLFVIELFNPDSAKGNTLADTSTAAACGMKSTQEKPPSLTSSQCNSKAASYITAVISSNNFYSTTNFGCSQDGETDGIDACNPSCPYLSSVSMNVNGAVTTVKLPKGDYVYERAIHYFSANATQYGCNATLKVTNAKSGKAVIVKAVDTGPYCGVHPKYGAMQVNGEPMRFDYSTTAAHAIGDPEVVRVDKVANDTPLGPVTACAADTGTSYVACALNDIKDTLTTNGNL
jgi:hypothetical protein